MLAQLPPHILSLICSQSINQLLYVVLLRLFEMSWQHQVVSRCYKNLMILYFAAGLCVNVCTEGHDIQATVL